MIDERDVLERALRRFEPEPGLTERVFRRKERKRRNQRIAAGAVGIAVFGAALGLVIGLGLGRTETTVVPGGGITGPTGPGQEKGPAVAELPVPSERVGSIGLPPVGTTPSTPERGELVLHFWGGPRTVRRRAPGCGCTRTVG